MVNTYVTRNTCTAIIMQPSSGETFQVTTVYGPTQDNLKQEFMNEVRGMVPLIKHPWVLLGDFNLVRWLVDRSGQMRGFDFMFEFNDLIRQLQVIDVPLQNRIYTWSNKQPTPVFSKLDRVFISTEWSTMLPDISLQAHEVIVSDHVPLVLHLKHQQKVAAPLRIEKFWLNYKHTTEVVQKIWGKAGGHNGDTCAEFNDKMREVQMELRQWHRKNFGEMET